MNDLAVIAILVGLAMVMRKPASDTVPRSDVPVGPFPDSTDTSSNPVILDDTDLTPFLPLPVEQSPIGTTIDVEGISYTLLRPRSSVDGVVENVDLWYRTDGSDPGYVYTLSLDRTSMIRSPA